MARLTILWIRITLIRDKVSITGVRVRIVMLSVLKGQDEHYIQAFGHGQHWNQQVSIIRVSRIMVSRIMVSPSLGSGSALSVAGWASLGYKGLHFARARVRVSQASSILYSHLCDLFHTSSGMTETVTYISKLIQPPAIQMKTTGRSWWK